MLKHRLIAGLMGLALFLSSQATLAQTEITFWTTEMERMSMDIQKSLGSGFEGKNPDIRVNIVPVERSTLLEKMIAAAATNRLPDIVLHPLEYALRFAREGILDIATATQLINDLGESTLASGALDMARYENGFAAVPIDGWGQVLVYRKDLLEEKGCPVPESWENIKKAAQVLHDPPLLWGCEVPTSPEHTYTQQVLEGLSLSNNAHLIDEATDMVDLTSSEFIATLRFYKELSKFTPPGNVYERHTKMDYLRGRSAMTMWSSLILSEICGLNGEEPVLVKSLHKKTGFVAVIKGPGGAAQYGQVNYLGITTESTQEAVKKWVMFLLDDAYLSWLGMRPETKFPVRKGTSDEPGKFIEGWKGLLFGLKIRSRISDWYDSETLNPILTGVEHFDRWGFAHGRGSLMVRMYQTNVIPIVLKRYLDGDIFTAEVTAELMNDLVKGLER